MNSVFLDAVEQPQMRVVTNGISILKKEKYNGNDTIP